MAGNGPGISAGTYFAVVVLIFIGAAIAIWFAIPGADAKHKFTAPSGRVFLELGEVCRETCVRVAIADETLADGTRQRLGCDVPLTEQRPVLLNAHPLWAADERSVEIVYADQDGIGGKFALDLQRDCTRTQ